MNIETLEKENDMLRQALVKFKFKCDTLEQYKEDYQTDEKLENIIDSLEAEIKDLRYKLDEIQSIAYY